MSGTRKMEKFELEAFVRERLEPAAGVSPPEPAAPPSSVSHPPVRPPSPSGPGPSDEPSVVVAADPPAYPEALRTRLAKKFVSLADDVTEAFGDFAIGAGAWAVELTAPTGMSTGGGKQALQHLRLRPRRPGYSAIVAGLVNQVERHAELRDYAHACVLHEVRFRRSLEITADEWEQLLRKAEVVLGNADVRCRRVGPPADLLAQRKGLTKVSRTGAVVLVVVLVLAVLVVLRIALAQ